MYDALTGYEFSAKIKQKQVNKKKEITEKKPINIKKHLAKIVSPVETYKSPRPITQFDSSSIYSFPKSERKLAIKINESNENRFGYNPRDSYPDPYEVTHHKYYIKQL